MATVRVEEAYSERDETIDAKENVTEIEIPYFVFNVDDESKALSAVRSNYKSVAGMSLESMGRDPAKSSQKAEMSSLDSVAG